MPLNFNACLVLEQSAKTKKPAHPAKKVNFWTKPLENVRSAKVSSQKINLVVTLVELLPTHGGTPQLQSAIIVMAPETKTLLHVLPVKPTNTNTLTRIQKPA